jgi:hypothetical protein
VAVWTLVSPVNLSLGDLICQMDTITTDLDLGIHEIMPYETPRTSIVPNKWQIVPLIPFSLTLSFHTRKKVWAIQYKSFKLHGVIVSLPWDNACEITSKHNSIKFQSFLSGWYIRIHHLVYPIGRKLGKRRIWSDVGLMIKSFPFLKERPWGNQEQTSDLAKK